MKTLMIVESPSKIKKLQKILGSGFIVMASFGHIRDLPPKELGVDLETFKPSYKVTLQKKQRDALFEKVKSADRVLLATDPDREGEAISWHILQVFKPSVPVFRMTFNAITESAVKQALGQLRQVDMQMVYAQEARRVLDRLVGFKTTPFLWQIFTGKKGQSAGRVQSVALRMVVERQAEVDSFVAHDYYELQANLQAKAGEFKAKMVQWQGKALDSNSFVNSAAMQAVLDSMKGKAWRVDELEEKPRSVGPKAPFITSTLQQAASSYLNLSPDKTMSLAQTLYEQGLISYMRTDSPTVSSEGVVMAAAFIEKTFGSDYLPKSARSFKAKADAQEAHEAIRPTDLDLREPVFEAKEKADLLRLYQLIWQRFVASQMADAIDDETRVRMRVSDGVFESLGRVERFRGWRSVYRFDEDEGKDEDEEQIGKLPKLNLSEALTLLKLEVLRKRTKAPKTYTEASLVRALEREGVGRPSTFASIIGRLKERGYVQVVKKSMQATDLGCEVSAFLTKEFPELFAVSFTASMEEELDQIALGKLSYKAFMGRFWGRFQAWLAQAESSKRGMIEEREAKMPRCPNCGKFLVPRNGKRGAFYGCTGYPVCNYSANLDAFSLTNELEG